MLPTGEMLKMLRIYRVYRQKMCLNWGNVKNVKNVKSFLGLDPPLFGFFFEKMLPTGEMLKMLKFKGVTYKKNA